FYSHQPVLLHERMCCLVLEVASLIGNVDVNPLDAQGSLSTRTRISSRDSSTRTAVPLKFPPFSAQPTPSVLRKHDRIHVGTPNAVSYFQPYVGITRTAPRRAGRTDRLASADMQTRVQRTVSYPPRASYAAPAPTGAAAWVS